MGTQKSKKKVVPFIPVGLHRLLSNWEKAEEYFVKEAPFTVYEPDETNSAEENFI